MSKCGLWGKRYITQLFLECYAKKEAVPRIARSILFDLGDPYLVYKTKKACRTKKEPRSSSMDRGRHKMEGEIIWIRVRPPGCLPFLSHGYFQCLPGVDQCILQLVDPADIADQFPYVDGMVCMPPSQTPQCVTGFHAHFHRRHGSVAGGFFSPGHQNKHYETEDSDKSHSSSIHPISSVSRGVGTSYSFHTEHIPEHVFCQDFSRTHVCIFFILRVY